MGKLKRFQRKRFNCCPSPVYHEYWSSSSSDGEWVPKSQPPAPPPNPINDPVAPRTPLGQTTELYYDAIPPDLCATQCSGLTMEACRNLNPQCAPIDSLPPDGWNGIKTEPPPRVQQPPQTVQYFYGHWMITNNDTQHIRPATDANGIPYDRHWRSVVSTASPTAYPSITLFQDKTGQWGNNDNLPPPWLQAQFVNEKQSATLIADWSAKGYTQKFRHSLSWTSTGGQLIVYHIDISIDISAPVLLETVTLPTDTLLYADAYIARPNPPNNPLSFREFFDGAPLEAYFTTAQNFTDQSVTIDKRNLAWQQPINQENVRVRLPSWSTNSTAERDVTQTIVLTNRCATSFPVTLRKGLNPSDFTTLTADPNVQLTITNVFRHTNTSPPPYTRQYNAISWPFDPIGTIDLDSYTTKVPIGIRRKQYSIKELVVNAWDWNDNPNDPLAYTLTPVSRAALATCFEPNGGFRSARSGNNPNAIINRFRFIECRLWFNNWPHFVGLTAGSTLPPINVVFDGSIRFAKTLEGLRTQYQFAPGTPTTSASYGNGYGQSDLQKQGIVSLGTGTNGVGQINVNKAEASWFMCRNMNRNDPVSIYRVVTLN